jgi:hypothetical protein
MYEVNVVSESKGRTIYLVHKRDLAEHWDLPESPAWKNKLFLFLGHWRRLFEQIDLDRAVWDLRLSREDFDMSKFVSVQPLDLVESVQVSDQGSIKLHDLLLGDVLAERTVEEFLNLDAYIDHMAKKFGSLIPVTREHRLDGKQTVTDDQLSRFLKEILESPFLEVNDTVLIFLGILPQLDPICELVSHSCDTSSSKS